MTKDNAPTPSFSVRRLLKKQRQIHDAAALDGRLKSLRKIADHDSLLYSKTSAQHAKRFLQNLCELHQTLFEPSIFLIGNGNTRLLWIHGKEQVGLQFLAGGEIQLVMFAKKADSATEIETKVGEKVTPTFALEAITAMNLAHLITPNQGNSSRS
ncbi:hypothetical protein AA14337_3248 [Acetobacter malorum DSM 14337]|uniref:Uncharacterized protein n=1 Tax=Acetobacter malorum DSM 14337 TaxID=1307910 RepID=A0ABQ0Q0J3_9PROT|nr:hypothetical protein [Acetobacter malorum]KXV09872.1 hypothetical protein AD930_02280 [Acetobacter malorum]GBQ86129.1 hypothetical protein AA14337_3248 [Acetobacter malorum DSM 14337]